MTAFVATYPLSTLQTRAMLGVPVYDSVGCGALYRGVPVAAVAVYLSGGVFWYAHAFFSARLGGGGGAGRSFLAAGAAGIANVVATNPLWVIVTRLQAGLAACPDGAARAADPFWALAGLAPNLVLVLFPALRQAVYDGVLGTLDATEATAGPALVTLAAGIAALVAAVATHPVQWYRSRLQAAHRPAGMPTRGGCFDGLTIKIAHTVLSSILMYVSKEQLTILTLSVLQT